MYYSSRHQYLICLTQQQVQIEQFKSQPAYMIMMMMMMMMVVVVVVVVVTTTMMTMTMMMTTTTTVMEVTGQHDALSSTIAELMQLPPMGVLCNVQVQRLEFIQSGTEVCGSAFLSFLLHLGSQKLESRVANTCVCKRPQNLHFRHNVDLLRFKQNLLQSMYTFIKRLRR